MTAASVIQGIAPQPTCRLSEIRFIRDMVIATRQTSMMKEMVVRTRVNPTRTNVQTLKPRFWRKAAAVAQIITKKVRPHKIGCRTSGKVRAPSSVLARSLILLSAGLIDGPQSSEPAEEGSVHTGLELPCRRSCSPIAGVCSSPKWYGPLQRP